MKLRKMLGSANNPYILALMKQIDTQSLNTLGNWAISYAKKHFLPIFERKFPKDFRIIDLLDNAQAFFDGKSNKAMIKLSIIEMREESKKHIENPEIEASIKACIEAALVTHNASHALSIAFYGAAALCYNKLGLNASREEYDQMADTIFIDMLETLKNCSILDEKNPVKVKWYC